MKPGRRACIKDEDVGEDIAEVRKCQQALDLYGHRRESHDNREGDFISTYHVLAILIHMSVVFNIPKSFSSLTIFSKILVKIR